MPQLLPSERVYEATSNSPHTAFWISQVCGQPYDYTLKVLKDFVNKGFVEVVLKGERELYKRVEPITMELTS